MKYTPLYTRKMKYGAESMNFKYIRKVFEFDWQVVDVYNVQAQHYRNESKLYIQTNTNAIFVTVKYQITNFSIGLIFH